MSGLTVAAGVLPPTGVVPGAGWTVGGLAGGALGGGVLDGVDCAHASMDKTSAIPDSTATWKAIRTVFIP